MSASRPTVPHVFTTTWNTLAFALLTLISFPISSQGYTGTYHHVNIAMKGDEAEAYCVSEYGTHLATILSDSDRSEINDLLDLNTSDMWIGLTRNQSAAGWPWVWRDSNYQCVGDPHHCTPQTWWNTLQEIHNCATIAPLSSGPLIENADCDNAFVMREFLCDQRWQECGGGTDPFCSLSKGVLTCDSDAGYTHACEQSPPSIRTSLLTAPCSAPCIHTFSLSTPFPSLAPVKVITQNVFTTEEPWPVFASTLLLATNDPTVGPTRTRNPTMDPTSDPTSDPTHVPTNDPTVPTSEPSMPTSSPSESPTMFRNESTIFDSFFRIQYLIKDLEPMHIETWVEAIWDITANITQRIDEAYYDATGLKIRFFRQNIEDILGMEVSDIDDSAYPYFLAAQDSISIDSKVECNRQGCIVLRNKHYTDVFEKRGTQYLRDYFTEYSSANLSDLTFEVARFGAIEVLDPDDPVTVGGIITENKLLFTLTVFMLLMSTVSFFAFLHKKEKYVLSAAVNTESYIGRPMTQALWYAPFAYGLQITVVLSDLNLSADLVNNDLVKSNSVLLFCAIASIAFVLIPYGANLYFAGKVPTMINKQNINAASFFKNNSATFIFLVLLGGGCFPTIVLLSSSCFGFAAINSGLTNNEVKDLNKIKITATILLQNVPQILIECVYASIIHEITINIGFAFVVSVLSAVCTPFIFSSHIDAKITHFQYYMEINEVTAESNDDMQSRNNNEKFEENKGKTQQMSAILGQICGCGPKNIQISRHCSRTEFGVIFYVTHFVKSDDFVSGLQIIQLFMEQKKRLEARLKKHFELNVLCAVTFTNIDIDGHDESTEAGTFYNTLLHNVMTEQELNANGKRNRNQNSKTNTYTNSGEEEKYDGGNFLHEADVELTTSFLE